MTEKIKETSALKTAVRVILTFILTAAVCMALLFITALIPKERIADSVKESADEKLALLSIQLETGRHHQIRVQCAHAGMPLLGDQKYGSEKSNLKEDIYAS